SSARCAIPTASSASAARTRGRSIAASPADVASRPSRRVASIVSTDSPSAATGPPAASTRSTIARSETRPSTCADQRVAPAATAARSSAPSSGSASATVEKYGPGYSALPSSSKSTASSRKPSPAPPSSSATETPSQPSSASSAHDAGSQPVSESASSATRSGG